MRPTGSSLLPIPLVPFEAQTIKHMRADLVATEESRLMIFVRSLFRTGARTKGALIIHRAFQIIEHRTISNALLLLYCIIGNVYVDKA